MASYGKYNYESTESRALKSIKADSYNKDMAKNLIQLNSNSEYMAQYLRKLQKGVDEANQNTIEQIQGLLSDIMVLFAGGSDTLLEFGDLKYLFQAIGALFGFDGTPLPINLLQAAWHFFSSYILPNGDFTEVINLIIDNAIAFILDVFGEVPVIGQALQQLAEWLSDLRDNLLWIINQFQGLIDFLAGIEDAVFGDIWNGLFNKFQLQIDLDFSSPAEFIASLIDALFGADSFIGGIMTGLFGEGSFFDGIVDGFNDFLGIDLPNMDLDISDALDQIGEVIDQIVGTPGSIISQVGARIANILGIANTANTTAGTASTNAGNALDTAVGWLTGFWNGITGQNAAPGDIGVPDAQAQAAAISETQAAQSAAIAQLQAGSDGTTFQGVNGTDSFSRNTASGLGGASWWNETLLTSDTGAYAYCNGIELKMVDGSGNSPHHYRYRCLIPGLATTITDYQKIIFTCGADQQENATSGNTACFRIYFRMNTAETQYGFIEIGGANLAQWGYKNGGSDTFVGSAFSCSRGTAGTNFTVQVGTTAGIRYYELYRNGTFVNRWIDSSNLVVTGPNNHGWGFGVRWGTRFFGQASPPSVGSISIADNLPPTILGSGFRAYNSSSGSAVNGVVGVQKFGNFYFNATAIKSDDLTYNPALNNRLTVSVAGWYMVNIYQKITFGANNGKRVSMALFKNGTADQIGGSEAWTSSWASTYGGSVGATFLIYCAAGDYLEPGYSLNSTTGGMFPGDPAGLESYWSVALVNRSYV